MNSIIRYATGLIVFAAGLTVINPDNRDSERLTEPSPRPLAASLPSPQEPLPAGSVANNEQSISLALPAHGNPYDIQPSFFTDLIRSMEKSGFERDAAHEVAMAIAQRPKLDTIAGLTLAGSLQAYMAETGQGLETAVAELAEFIEQPDTSAKRFAERFGSIQPDTEALIGEKLRNGNDVAAQRLIEEALLQRFNPSLAAKLFVPRTSPAMCCEVLRSPPQVVVARADPPRAEQRRRSAGRSQVVSIASKRSSANRRRVSNHAGVDRGSRRSEAAKLTPHPRGLAAQRHRLRA